MAGLATSGMQLAAWTLDLVTSNTVELGHPQEWLRHYLVVNLQKDGMQGVNMLSQRCAQLSAQSWKVLSDFIRQKNADEPMNSHIHWVLLYVDHLPKKPGKSHLFSRSKPSPSLEIVLGRQDRRGPAWFYSEPSENKSPMSTNGLSAQQDNIFGRTATPVIVDGAVSQDTSANPVRVAQTTDENFSVPSNHNSGPNTIANNESRDTTTVLPTKSSFKQSSLLNPGPKNEPPRVSFEEPSSSHKENATSDPPHRMSSYPTNHDYYQPSTSWPNPFVPYAYPYPPPPNPYASPSPQSPYSYDPYGYLDHTSAHWPSPGDYWMGSTRHSRHSSPPPAHFARDHVSLHRTDSISPPRRSRSRDPGHRPQININRDVSPGRRSRVNDYKSAPLIDVYGHMDASDSWPSGEEFEYESRHSGSRRYPGMPPIYRPRSRTHSSYFMETDDPSKSGRSDPTARSRTVGGDSRSKSRSSIGYGDEDSGSHVKPVVLDKEKRAKLKELQQFRRSKDRTKDKPSASSRAVDEEGSRGHRSTSPGPHRTRSSSKNLFGVGLEDEIARLESRLGRMESELYDAEQSKDFRTIDMLRHFLIPNLTAEIFQLRAENHQLRAKRAFQFEQSQSLSNRSPSPGSSPDRNAYIWEDKSSGHASRSARYSEKDWALVPYTKDERLVLSPIRERSSTDSDTRSKIIIRNTKQDKVQPKPSSVLSDNETILQALRKFTTFEKGASQTSVPMEKAADKKTRRHGRTRIPKRLVNKDVLGEYGLVEEDVCCSLRQSMAIA